MPKIGTVTNFLSGIKARGARRRRKLVTVPIFLAALLPVAAGAQAPRANGETLTLQNYAGTTGNMHAVVAAKKGFCDKYNFKCEIKTINSSILGIQTVVGKSLDVAQTGTGLVAASNAAGTDLVIVANSLPGSVTFVAARADVPFPNKAKGYPAVMADFKGLKIGTTARGSAEELFFNVMLKDGGLTPSDVTFVAVGGPATAYTSMVVGKQVDAVIIFEPVKALCNFTKACSVIVDMTEGQGPQIVKDIYGSGVPLVMRREFADGNPALMKAFYAAMTDAATWFNDPKNFDELVEIYKPLITFGDMPGGDELRKTWIKSIIGAYSKDLKVSRDAVKASIAFNTSVGLLTKPMDVNQVLWDKAP